MSDEGKKRQVGPFELGAELGVGGMGIVYRAIYQKNGAECAVKLLAPDLTADEKVAKRFERETDILKKLSHPNIVKYYGAGTSKTQRYYAMELVKGGSLERTLRKAGRLPWEKAIDYGLQIARALEHAHNAGIIHRDLKPANLLVAKDGILKLTDFGIARDTQATALTQAGKTVGTMMYMAPEQITGKYPINRKTDLYALGCVIFQMLTGRTPFESNTQAELLFKHIDEAPPSVLDFDQNIPFALSKLVDELLAKEPDKRPFDALAVQVKLDEILKSEQQRRAAAATVPAGITAGGGVAATLVNTLPDPAKKKKKKRKATNAAPFYERTWFLGGILLILIGSIVYAFLPEAEAKVFERIQTRMRSEDPNDWIESERDIGRFLQRFPQSANAAQVTLWDDQINMHRAEKNAELNEKIGRDPQSEAERLFGEAKKYEQFGDRITALEKYEAMPKVIEPDDISKPFLGLARKRATMIRDSVGSDTDRTAFIKSQLEEADKLAVDGQKLAAQQKWNAIIKLYGNNPEFDTFTRQAQERLDEISKRQ